MSLLITVLEASINAIGITNIEGRLIYVNRSLVKMWGFERRDEIIGRQVTEFWEGDGIHKTLADLMSSGRAIGEDTGKRKDGSLFPVEFTASMITNEVDGAQYMFGSFIDISERKRVEHRLRQSRDAYESLINNLPCMVYQGRHDWTVTRIGAFSQQISGYTDREFLTGEVNWCDLIHPDDRQGVMEETATCPEPPDQLIEQEYRIISKSGETRWVRDIKRLVFEDGRLTSADGVVIDVTEQKLLQRKLARADSQASLGIMAAGLAHEMNNPLSVMLGYVELLQSRFNDLPKQTKAQIKDMKKSLDKIKRAGMRCKDIVHGLLNFSYSLGPDRRWDDLSQALNGAIKLAVEQRDQQDFQLVLDVAEDLSVRGHLAQLQLAFKNLLSNALDVTEPGGRVTVRAFLDQDPRYCVIEITDSGPGIPEEHLNRIFVPFFSTKPVGMGTGLGLSLVDTIIKDHGGEVIFDSEMGQGTTVRVRLPVKAQHEPR